MVLSGYVQFLCHQNTEFSKLPRLLRKTLSPVANIKQEAIFSTLIIPAKKQQQAYATSLGT